MAIIGVVICEEVEPAIWLARGVAIRDWWLDGGKFREGLLVEERSVAELGG